MAPAKDRRTQPDRRIKDGDPPRGWKERRHAVERRKPEVTEITFREWVSRQIEWRELCRMK